MIYQICNNDHEQIETFFKIAIIKKTAFNYFNHLVSDSALQTLIENIPENAEAMIIDLLPENLDINANSRIGSGGSYWRVRANFTVTPLDRALQDLLEQYLNQEVIILLERYGSNSVYGTTEKPLIFSYAERHDSQAQNLRGYTVNISGDTLAGSRILDNVEIDFYSRGLAFQLARDL